MVVAPSALVVCLALSVLGELVPEAAGAVLGVDALAAFSAGVLLAVAFDGAAFPAVLLGAAVLLTAAVLLAAALLLGAAVLLAAAVWAGAASATV